ncbi:MAG: hypothetical protein GYB26_09145 [Gammaproteobacteria bacterium]|uniref:Uncharacterized protein n=1 Tax=Marinobacter litoralis TaxID=187981 RepID=A0A3M2RLE7_9GAMM|nr:hypothetical protein [Marinobacter litoralis]MBR9871289.1 hypothetical protein [Gammaproteobacteria bacterium]RMJ06170.1 hypothetical protein DOQ08_00855 [Marinobacter litoralis]
MMLVTARAGLLFSLALLIGMPVSANPAKPVEETQAPVLEVAGLSANSGEDDPRILYILPWQGPSLPRRPRAELNHQIPELTHSVNATAIENHRLFRETLNPLVLEPTNVAPVRDKP